jgi:succinate dehydrogenase/fumarate reductase flavoprotein subunit
MNMSENGTSKKWSRRDFLKGTLAATGAAAVTTLGEQEAQAKPAIPKKWDKQADVVCIGYGGAGAVAAISAHDAGAKVLILEKMPESGGNTAVSLGGFLSPSNVEEAKTYISSLYKLSLSEMDSELVNIYAVESVKNADWMKGLREGTELMNYGGAGYPAVPGAKSMNKYVVQGKHKGMNGRSLNL